MTLTFNLVIRFLIATHHLIMIISCAKLFSNPTMHNKVMGRTQTGSTEVLTFDLATWFLFATHRLVMIIICAKLFSNPTMHSKVMGRTQTGSTEVYAQCLSADYDLDLATWFLFMTHCLVMMITCAKLFSIPTMHNKVMGRTRTGPTEVYAQSLSVNCDLNL